MELLWFVIGTVVGVITLAVICRVIKIDLPGDKEEDTQPEFRPIATQDTECSILYNQLIETEKELIRIKEELEDTKHVLKTVIELANEAYKNTDYWKREAIKSTAKLGEQKIRLEELKEKYKNASK